MMAPKISRARALTLVSIAAFAALAAWTFANLEVTTEITHFLPSSEDRELARVVQDMSSSDLNRTITLTIEARDTERATAAARELSRLLARRSDVEWVRHGPDEELNDAFYELYFPRRLAFFTDEPDAAGLLSDSDLRARAHALKQQLMSPTGTFVRQIAPSDPLLSFAHHLERLREAQGGGLEVVDGHFVTEDRRHAVVFVASRESPFAIEHSRRLLSGIEDAFARVQRARGADLRLEQSSVHQFAVRSQETISTDVTRISTVSTIAVIVIFLVLFRSFRHVILSTLPLGAGMIAGLAATQIAFGEVHGMTLAFGSTLIGVGVDFATHYMNHHTLDPSPKGPFGSLRHILPGLALGAGTTIGGLAGLAWTSFPGIRELAVFATVGVSACLIVTCVVLPPWMPVVPTPTRLHVWLARSLAAGLGKLRGSRSARYGIPALALIVCALGFWKMRWIDDPRALNSLDPALLEEDERVRERVSRMDAGRVVIAWADDEETALRRNDEVHRRLRAAEGAGELESMRSLHGLLWSERAQRTSFDTVARSPEIEARLARALEAEGFVASAFEPFGEALRERPEPLRWRELVRSPIGPLVQSFRFESGRGRVAFVTLLRGGDVDAIERRLEGMHGVRLFDQSRFMQRAYGKFRVRTLEMVGIGLVLVFAMILARYRRLAPSIAAFAPAILASATSIAIVALSGQELNLMHLVALLLVLSMGEDYGVFMVEAHGAGDDIGNAMSSVLLACVTTVLSFGLLAMSSNPALRALGSITGLGVLLSLVLTPMGWLFLKEKPDTR